MERRSAAPTRGAWRTIWPAVRPSLEVAVSRHAALGEGHAGSAHESRAWTKRGAPVLDHAARDRLLAQGCLERRYGRLRLNPGFLDVSNTVIAALLVGPGGS